MARRKHKRRARRGLFGRFVRRNPIRRARRNPIRRKRRSTRTIVVANPVRRRRRRMRRNPIRKYRRNPIRLGGGRGKLSFRAVIGPALAAGLGGVAADLMMGYAPLPAMLTTGKVKYVTKGALSLGAGMLVARFGSRKFGEALALGGLAIAIHDAAREQLASWLPAAKFGEYIDGMGYYNAGYPVGQAGMGQYMGEIDYGGDQSGTLGDMFATNDFGRVSPFISPR